MEQRHQAASILAARREDKVLQAFCLSSFFIDELTDKYIPYG